MNLLTAREQREWRDQELALFARRAHRQLGRGFVIADDDESQPIYVTQMAGAPPELIHAVLHYDPDREALVVWDDKRMGHTVVLTCVRIEPRN